MRFPLLASLLLLPAVALAEPATTWAELDAAWNARDAQRFAELFTDDASMVFVDRGDALAGRAEILARFERQFAATAPEYVHRTQVNTVGKIGPWDAVDATVTIYRGDEPVRAFWLVAVMDGERIAYLRIFEQPQAQP